MLILSALALFSVMLAPQSQGAAADPNAPTRPPVSFRVFKDMDKPLAGSWELEVPESAVLRVELRENEPGRLSGFTGVEAGTTREILSVTPRKEGVGYEGHLYAIFEPCGLATLAITEFLPLGDAIVMKFDSPPPMLPCPPIDGGKSGRFVINSRGGGPVRLRDLSDITSTSTREEYSVGGDRPTTTTTTSYALGGVRLDHGTEVRFVSRVKGVMDSVPWFQVETILKADAASSSPPRGCVPGDSLRLVGSLSLRRVSQPGSGAP